MTTSPPEPILRRLSARLTETLGDRLLSLAVHGSYVAGDFQPGRSDVDLVCVVDGEFDRGLLDRLQTVHDRLIAEFPEWDDHVEVDYVTPAMVRDLVAGVDRAHTMIRISPGEPIHLVPATRHYLINWHAALQHDHPIAGSRPSSVLPAIPDRLAQDCIADHVRNWPDWIDASAPAGFGAYAVLALCRAEELLATGQQLSKKAAADRAIRRFQQTGATEQVALITWARDWWYAGGTDDEPARAEEVLAFVSATVERLVGDHPVGGAATTR